MVRISILLGLWLGLVMPGGADDGSPVQDESLAYSINWPSGLSLGEARVLSHRANDRWHFEMVLDAGVPGFAVSDHFRSIATADLCSLEFERETLHGKRSSREKTTFDYQKGAARRVTLNGGGKSEARIPSCVRDALTFVFFARRELGQGRVPPAQPVVFGSEYQVKADYSGPQNITYNDKKTKADRMAVSIKGPKSDINFEVFFALDSARTPLAVRVPLSVGVVSMELVR